MNVKRQLQERLKEILTRVRPQGVILTGIVGSGKTTLIEETLREIGEERAIFRFSGDDVRFREAIASDSRYIANHITAKTRKNTVVYIDEIQKTEAVFDAVKIAFDEIKASFVLSGSNPDFLNTRAKFNLQRRADLWFLPPFSLSEILTHEKLVPARAYGEWLEILLQWPTLKNPESCLELSPEQERICDEHLIYGGLPLSYLATGPHERMTEVRKVVERGFDRLSQENDSVTELIRIELGKIHAREFAYQGIFQRTRLRRRERINEVIDQMMNHGYLLRRQPFSFKDARRTYLSILSFVDPGVVTYLTGEDNPAGDSRGYRIEGLVHARLDALLKNEPLKFELGYFKPFKLDSSGNVKYQAGEVDFIVRRGKRVLPVEVKSGLDRANMDLSGLTRVLDAHKTIPFGIVLYAGIPYADHERNILFWPWWMI